MNETGEITVSGASEDILLRALYKRGADLRGCTDIDDVGNNCEKIGIYPEGGYGDGWNIGGIPKGACYCPHHLDQMKNGQHFRWCMNPIVLPNGDTARCQGLGNYSWEFHRYLCPRCLARVQERTISVVKEPS